MGRGLQSGEGQDEAWRWVAEASIIEETNYVKSRDGVGAKLRARTACMCTVGVCVYIGYTPPSLVLHMISMLVTSAVRLQRG